MDFFWLLLQIEVPRTGLDVEKSLKDGGRHENQDRVHHIQQGAKYVVESGRWVVELDDTRKNQGEVIAEQEARDKVHYEFDVGWKFLLFFREIKRYQLKPEDPKYCL